MSSIDTREFVYVTILFPHLTLPVLFFLPLFVPLFVSLSLSLCFSWCTFSNLVFLFILCFLLCFSHSFPPSLHLCTLHPHSHSSLCAGCRGSCFIFTMSRVNVRVRQLLFSSLLRQDLSFFQDTKTGGAWSPGLGLPWTFLASQLPSSP